MGHFNRVDHDSNYLPTDPYLTLTLTKAKP